MGRHEAAVEAGAALVELVVPGQNVPQVDPGADHIGIAGAQGIEGSRSLVEHPVGRLGKPLASVPDGHARQVEQVHAPDGDPHPLDALGRLDGPRRRVRDRRDLHPGQALADHGAALEVGHRPTARAGQAALGPSGGDGVRMGEGAEHPLGNDDRAALGRPPRQGEVGLARLLDGRQIERTRRRGGRVQLRQARTACLQPANPLGGAAGDGGLLGNTGHGV